MLQNSNAIEDGGYVIDRSLRFMAASSQYLTRTPSVAGNLTTWTWSSWIKITPGVSIYFINHYTSSALNNYCWYDGSSGKLIYQLDKGTPYQVASVATYRDPSAWYHVMFSWDSSQANASDRMRIYVNGLLQTLTGTQAPQNSTSIINSTVLQTIGRRSVANDGYADGYQAEVHFIDGQALTPSSFGEINSATSQWVAKKYTGTYGTNGFYLDFKDGTSTTTLGQDKSGNGNNWALANFTRSAGVNDCWMLDVPSGNGSTGVQPSGNYAVLNPLKRYSANLNFSKGNLTVSDNSASISTAISSFFLPTTGKYYFEVTATTISAANGFVGVATESTANGNTAFQSEGRYRSNGDITNLAGTLQTGGTSYTSGDVIGVAVDVDNGTVQFYKNNVAQGATPSFTFTSGTNLVPYISTDNNAAVKTFEANFGQRSFAYTPPTGFKALCTANLPAPSIVKPSDHFNVSLWVGTGATNKRLTNFPVGLLWNKRRNVAENHWLVDKVRGASLGIFSNLTNAEVSQPTAISSLDSDGFTLGADVTGYTNAVGSNYVGWAWKASDSSAVANISGTITSQVSANPAAGFSIVTYTGTGANATVGHGLGIAPSVIIVKNVTNAVSYWCVQHKSLPATSVLRLNDTTASATSATIWSSNINTSLVFSIGAANETNRSTNTMVAYCFAEIAGYSKFGSYTGNGSADGPFVYTGFRPRFVMIKRINTAGGNWLIVDAARSPENTVTTQLYPNLSNAEMSGTAIDFTSNGFKIRTTEGTVNLNAETIIYMAFAETSMTYSNAR